MNSRSKVTAHGKHSGPPNLEEATDNFKAAVDNWPRSQLRWEMCCVLQQLCVWLQQKETEASAGQGKGCSETVSFL